MASLAVLHIICKKSGCFVSATKPVEIAVAGCSKIIVEHYLLKYEWSNYFMLSCIPMMTGGADYSPFSVPLFYTCLITSPIIYILPVYRTYKSIATKNLQMIQYR